MKKRRSGVVYRSYSFTTVDPIIDRVQSLVTASGRSKTRIYKDGGASISTLSNWFSGKTRRPQFCTIAATVRAIGGDVGYRTADGTWTSVIGRRSSNGKHAGRSAHLH